MEADPSLTKGSTHTLLSANMLWHPQERAPAGLHCIVQGKILPKPVKYKAFKTADKAYKGLFAHHNHPRQSCMFRFLFTRILIHC